MGFKVFVILTQIAMYILMLIDYVKKDTHKKTAGFFAANISLIFSSILRPDFSSDNVLLSAYLFQTVILIASTLYCAGQVILSATKKDYERLESGHGGFYVVDKLVDVHSIAIIWILGYTVLISFLNIQV